MTAAAPAGSLPPKTWQSETIAWAKAIGAALLIWIVLRSYVVEAFRIPSSSMENTLLIGDFLFVNKAVFGGELDIPVVGIGRIADLARVKCAGSDSRHSKRNACKSNGGRQVRASCISS